MCLEGGGKHLSFKGLRKIGKSELAKYYIATHPKQQLAYIDLENLNLTVELFSEKTIDVAEANNVLLTDADDLYSIKKAVFRHKRKVM
jgi:hypothetical protein